jgi:hypothetical protein
MRTDRFRAAADTAFISLHQGTHMAQVRIDRMIRELHTEPSLQFFQGLFALFAAR